MSKRDETIAHNLGAVAQLRENLTRNVKVGAECPKCGGGVNPTILANFGHCLACQSASIGLRPFQQG
jgi:hypothetical protein